MALLFETLWGDLVVDLDEDASLELKSNFLKLAKARFFTNTLVFSVTPNRFCQLGDPVGDGTGGTSIYGLLDETSDYRKSSRRFLASTCGRPVSQPELQRKGLVVATCSSNIPNTIGSQFLITTADGPNNALDGFIQDESLFVVLGQVVEDDNDVLEKINAAFCDNKGRPYADIRLERAIPIYDPYDDPPGLSAYLKTNGIVLSDDGKVTRSPSPVRPKEEVVSKRISAADVDAEDLEDEEMLQSRLMKEQEETEKRHDKSRAVVLEMLGDLPDADIRAPEDVLFLCKLNPVTVDEDLELIFSRFDESVKVEIIRDPDTGASLQYAFAEFSNKRAAEEAYFKMNNALIDDRRIKVDFSQSVAKLWDKYHQRARMPKPNRADGFFVEKNLTPQPRRDARGHERSIQSRNQGFQQIDHRYHRGNRDDHPQRQENEYANQRREEGQRHIDRSSHKYGARSERGSSRRRDAQFSRQDGVQHRRNREERDRYRPEEHDRYRAEDRDRHHVEDRDRHHAEDRDRHHEEKRDRKRRSRHDNSSSRSDASDRRGKKSKKSKHKKESKKKKHRKHRRRDSSSSRSQSR